MAALNLVVEHTRDNLPLDHVTHPEDVDDVPFYTINTERTDLEAACTLIENYIARFTAIVSKEEQKLQSNTAMGRLKLADSLITVLQLIETCDEIKEVVSPEIRDEDGGYLQEDLHVLVNNAVSLVNGCLITEKGECDWDVEDKLEAAGFLVCAGEKDSFGWLSGIIQTSKGGIVYG